MAGKRLTIPPVGPPGWRDLIAAFLTIPPVCPPGWRDLIASCWASRPEDRPRSGSLVKRVKRIKEYREPQQRPKASPTGCPAVGGFLRRKIEAPLRCVSPLQRFFILL